MVPEKTILFVAPEVQIPLSEIEFSYARSSGPGGQNVNKVNSKAVLRWNAIETQGIQESARPYLLARIAPELNTEGEVVISSDRFRDQGMNREDCLEKLKLLLRKAAVRPKKRKKTRPSRSSQRKAQEKKTQHSRKKTLRGKVRDFE